METFKRARATEKRLVLADQNWRPRSAASPRGHVRLSLRLSASCRKNAWPAVMTAV